MSALEKAELSEVVLSTPRLTLAPLQAEYAAPLFELLNDWEVVKMLSEVSWPLRLEDTQDFIASLPSAATDDFAILMRNAAGVGKSHPNPVILRCNDDAVGIASKDDPASNACFEGPLRGAPQHEEGGLGFQPVGVASIKKSGSGEPPRQMPRLGYWIGRKYWRHGYGTEAIGALVDYAFRTYPVERIGAGVFHDNPASRGLLEKLGFSAMGSGSTYCRSRNSTMETVDMQTTRSAWAAREGRA
jgi:RimJ/RimL family protein N-acetyltransferase